MATKGDEQMTPGEQTREFYREQGRQQEQARIIKLLEAQQKIFGSGQYSTTGGYAERFALHRAIQKIKGE
jgi:hypothetical protein